MKMKKNQFKKYVQLTMLFFGITLFLFNCEKEDEFQDLSLPQSNVKTYPIAKENIPDIVNYINVNKKSKGDFSCGTIDYTTIFTTIDSLEVQTYSFPFDIEDGDDDSNTFYNFVVRTSPDQTYRSFVFKYTPSNDYKRGVNHFDYFNGSLKIYDYDTFCNTESTQGRTDDESPCPTNQITIYGSGSGSNSAPNSGGNGTENDGANYNSGSNTTGSGSTAIGYVGSSSSPCTVTIMTSCSSGGTTPHSRKSCGSNTGVPYAEINCAPNYNRTDDPCGQAEDFSGAASINTGRILKNIKERLTMTSERIAWLNNSENNVEINALANFLEDNNWSEEAIAEAEEVIDAWVDNTWVEDVELFDDVQGPEITDITDYLKCFDTTKKAEITLYVDQPTANSSDTWSGWPSSPEVGHTFIGIKQDSITRLVGFYPAVAVNPFSSPSSSSSLNDNSNHTFDVSITTEATASQLQNIVTNIENFNSTYNLNTYNCTNFGIDIVNNTSLNIPNTSGNWPGGGGSNPGNLGQDIRNMTLSSGTTRNNSGGTSPSNNGTCN